MLVWTATSSPVVCCRRMGQVNTEWYLRSQPRLTSHGSSSRLHMSDTCLCTMTDLRWRSWGRAEQPAERLCGMQEEESIWVIYHSLTIHLLTYLRSHLATHTLHYLLPRSFFPKGSYALPLELHLGEHLLEFISWYTSTPTWIVPPSYPPKRFSITLNKPPQEPYATRSLRGYASPLPYS